MSLKDSKKFQVFLLISIFVLVANSIVLYAKPRFQQDERYFTQTGYRVDDDVIWDYFQSRGAVSTFGYPVSETFNFQAVPVQIFQRHVLQRLGSQPRPLNLLDPDVMPINEFGGLTFPPYDANVAKEAPAPNTPNYGVAVQQHLERTVSNASQSQSVGFLDYYLNAAPADAGALRTL